MTVLGNSAVNFNVNMKPGAARFGTPEAIKSLAEIHVWLVPFPLLRELSYQFDCLTDKEKIRASKLATKKGLRDFVVARSFLRKLLAARMDCLPCDVDIKYTNNGKPYVINGPVFNVSHCDRLLSVAIANNTFSGLLGIDVEQRITDPAVLRLSEKCFSQTERDQLAAYRSKSASYRAFTRGWSRKEAVIKAIGAGLNAPLNRFDVCLKQCRNNEQNRHDAKHSLLLSSDIGGVTPDNCELHDLGTRLNCEVAIAIIQSENAYSCALKVHDVDLRQLTALAENNNG